MGMIDILKNGLVEDPEQTLSKLTLVECITVLTKGKKLQVAPANYLLSKLMRMLSIEDSAIEDEIPLSGTQDLGKDLSMSQIMGEGGSKDSPQDLDNTQRSEVTKQSKSDETVKEAGDKSPNKKKDLCRFYARGHCTKKGDCRFDHPSICKVFRQFGDKAKDQKGCDGKCEAFHPNVCHSSARDRTCTWTECRFFHLKGTKLLNRGQQGPSNSNWRSNQDQNSNTQHRLRPNQNQSRSESHSKNGSAGLNSNRSKKKGGKKNQSQRPDPIPQKAAANTGKAETVTQEEKKQLGQTLEAILKRLSAMESRQAMFAQPAAHQMSHIQPLLSPAVPPPGTQTQFQWASQQPWTQTQ